MKRTYTYIIYIASILSLCGLLPACEDSREDIPGTDGEGDPVYISLTISANDARGTKAGNSPQGGEDGDGREDATADENHIDNLIIFLYRTDENGIGRNGINATNAGEIQIEKVIEFSGQEIIQSDENTSTVTTATKRVTGLEYGQRYDVLAVANMKNEWKDNSTTLSELRDKIYYRLPWEKKTNEDGTITYTNFVMSSSGPATHRDFIDITAGNASQDNPATGYLSIERLAAKVTCEVKKSYSFPLGGVEGGTMISATIEGVALINIPAASSTDPTAKVGSYLFKRLSTDPEGANGTSISYLRDEEDNAGTDAWWVVDVASKSEKTIGEHPFYDPDRHYIHIKVNSEEWARNWITYSWNNTDSETKLLGYVIENTNAIESDYDLRERATGVLFKVKYAPEGQAGDFYVYENKVYNSLEVILKVMKESNPTQYEDLTLEHLQAHLSDYDIVKYEEGYSYLPYWIKHDEDNDDTAYGTMEYGIVRNNLYELHVTSITDFGEMIVTVKAWDVWDTEDVLVVPKRIQGKTTKWK